MSQPQRVPPKGHVRNKSSSTRSSRPRSSTKGPLDAQDDPMPSPSTPQSARASPGARSRQAPTPPAPQPGEARPKDFSFLLRPDIYHPLPPLNVPAAFRDSPKQPDPATPLEQLLARGHFRAAATAAAEELTGGTPGSGVDARDGRRILSLLYTRLACLTLIDATALAAHEAKALEDLNNAPIYVDEATGEHLAPWELRVLNVRLQALGFGDPRRAVMSYHELAREARAHAARAAAAGDGAARGLWAARLGDLGVKVAGALVDMDDLAGAAHHLGGLRDGGDGKLALCKALLWLHVGDVERARECARRCSGAQTERLILALCDMADAEYEAALARWQELGASLEADEMVGVNTAVCLLYLGRMHEGREMLEGLVDAGLSSRTLLFNLATMYELCTDKNRPLKTGLTERVAAMDESPAGWERLNGDFKL